MLITFALAVIVLLAGEKVGEASGRAAYAVTAISDPAAKSIRRSRLSIWLADRKMPTAFRIVGGRRREGILC
jgi:hypothetical protein